MPTEQSPTENSGKAFLKTAESVYDELAERDGLDEYGDEIVENDDAAIEATEEVDESAIEDAPALEDEPEIEGDPVLEATPEIEEPNTPLSDEALLPPHTWQQDWKDTFNTISDPVMKQAILEQNANMNKSFTEKMTSLAVMKRDQEGITNSLLPHQERLQRAGITPDIAIQRSLAWDAHIQSDPVQGIMDMAKAYGVDLAATVQNQTQNEEYLTPMERQLRQENSELGQSVQQIQQRQQQWDQYQQQQNWDQRQNNAHAVLDEFMNATDEAGNRLHPYIEHVAPLMTQLIENRMAPDLATAYDMAENWSPEIRAARDKQRKAGQVQAAREKADKVRKASRSGIVGKGSGKEPAGVRSTEDQVSAAYDKIANA